jgi:hypothetical protein
MTMEEEPGIDRHEWATDWEEIQEDVRDSPAEALSELDDLVARMMTAHGLELEEQAGQDVGELDATREFAGARAITRQVDNGEDVDPGDIAYAVNAYTELYQQLIDYGSESEESI